MQQSLAIFQQYQRSLVDKSTLTAASSHCSQLKRDTRQLNDTEDRRRRQQHTLCTDELATSSTWCERHQAALIAGVGRPHCLQPSVSVCHWRCRMHVRQRPSSNDTLCIAWLTNISHLLVRQLNASIDCLQAAPQVRRDEKVQTGSDTTVYSGCDDPSCIVSDDVVTWRVKSELLRDGWGTATTERGRNGASNNT